MPVVVGYNRAKYHTRNPSPILIVQPDPWILACRDSYLALGQHVFGFTPAEIHQGWGPILQTEQDSECLHRIAGDPTNLLSFRGSAKTTWLRIFFCWALGHNPQLQTGWISFTEAVAIKSSRWIRRGVQLEKYQQVFPHIRPGSEWSDRQWAIDWKHAGVSEFTQDFTFAALGITGSITSNRFNYCVFDDVIKSSKAIANEEIRNSMITNYGEVIEPCVAAVPGSRMISLGTRFRRDDIHATEFTTENGWTVIQQGAIILNDDGTERSAWERIPLNKLQEIRQKRPITFSYQWLNQIPPNDDEAIIKAEWIHYGEVPKAFDDLALGVDLAASEQERGDYTAFVLIGKVGDRYYIVEAIRERIAGNLEKIARICELRRKYGQFKVIVERVAYQASFAGDWKDEMKRRRLTWKCREYIPKGDKDQRLEGISGVFANGLVTLNRDRDMNPLVAELLRHNLDHDDLSDGCVIALSSLLKRSNRNASFA